MRLIATQIIAGAMVIAFLALAQPAITQGAEAENLGNNTQIATDSVDLSTKVTQITGTARFRTDPDQQWQPLTTDTILPVGSEIQTGLRSTVTLDIGPNSTVTVQSLAHMTIAQVTQDKGNVLRTQLAMKYGKIAFNVHDVGFKNDFTIATPTGVMAVKGTEGSVTTYGETTTEGNENNKNDSINTDNNDGTGDSLSGDESTGDGEGGEGNYGNEDDGGDDGENDDTTQDLTDNFQQENQAQDNLDDFNDDLNEGDGGDD